MKLTLPQYDVYYEQLLYPESPIYNIGAKIKIEGTLHQETFEKAYDALIRQHDAYRTLFSEEKGEVVARVVSQEKYVLDYRDFSDRAQADVIANQWMQERFVQPFEILGNDFLHKFILIKVADNFHYLFSVYHHIITDGWGTSLMFQRLVKNYNELLEHGKVVTEYPFSYETFVQDDANYQQSEAFQADQEYWKTKFSQLPENLFEKKNTSPQLHKSSRKSLTISRVVYNEINALSKQYKVSTFHFILGALYVYFGRKHQNKDFAIGLPVLNRSKSIFKKTVGLFMGVSPLRMQLDVEATFEEFVASIKNQLRQDYRHQRLPLGKLIQSLGVFSEKEKIFNITLSYEKQNYAHNFGDTQTKVIPLTHQSERVALAIYIREFDEDEDVTIDFDYNLNYFDEVSIGNVVTHYETLLHDLLANPSQKIKHANYLTNTEKNQLVVDFNKIFLPIRKEFTFLNYFTDQAKNLGSKVAVYDTANQYTYSELDQKSNQIAQYITELTKNSETNCIGVLVARSADVIVLLLGILKAGKSYIPLDSTFPNERLQYIIDHSGLEILISDQPETGLQVPNNEIISTEKIFTASVNFDTKFTPNVISHHTAYIIYTSGSTGNPKGVAVRHEALLNFLLSIQKEPGIAREDTVFSVTTYSFDISILEFFVPLISGATLYMANQEVLATPERIIQTLATVKPSIVQATPSFYQLLFNAGWRGSKDIKILCGGDALSTSLATKLLKTCEALWNMYGPTETTIWSSTKHITKAIEATNIGKPIANTQFYILDDDVQLLPVGALGNLYIGGKGLSAGYYKNQVLTDQKFIQNPFGEGLIYETGDVGYWTEDGEIIFGGRNDNQVKIRGYRIELEDIETKLNALATVKQAIVVPKKTDHQEAFLVAYIIPATDNFDATTCRETLATQLPSYMIPSFFSTLEKFPLTLNKKVDRKTLIHKKIERSTEVQPQEKIKDALQQKLSEFWKETLQFKGEIHSTDNYFTLGGHSLNAVKLVYKINQELGYTITLKTIFENPTLQSLANYLKHTSVESIKSIPKATEREAYQITPSQFNIWLASQHSETSIAYNMVASYAVDGSIDEKRLETALQQLMQKHEMLRTNFVERNGNVYQKIETFAQREFGIEIIKSSEKDVSKTVATFINTEFDLASDFLLKVMLIKDTETTATLVFCTHHIIMDGWSLEIFTKEFLQAYHQPKTIEKTGEALQFKDYAVWLEETTNTEENHAFWTKYLDKYVPKESFKTDEFLDEIHQSGQHYFTSLDAIETEKIQTFVQAQQTTVHNFLASALQVLIHKLYEHTDMVIGTVNAGRNHPQTNDMIGMFVKTLPLRTQLETNATFEEILANVTSDVLQLDTFQDVPNAVQSKNLFDVLLAFQNTDFSHKETIHIENASLKAQTVDVNASRLPLLFNFAIVNNKLTLQISYNAQKYDKTTIEWIWLKFQKLTQELIENPQKPIETIEIPLPFESEDVVDIDFNF
jgi:surfactin family lipopeptide synthetase A